MTISKNNFKVNYPFNKILIQSYLVFNNVLRTNTSFIVHSKKCYFVSINGWANYGQTVGFKNVILSQYLTQPLIETKHTLKILGCFNPILGQKWTNPTIGIHFKITFLTQCLSLFLFIGLKQPSNF